MALSNLGQVPCPYCTQPAQVGIAKDGKGNAVHLLCRPCGINLQAHRHSVVGKQLESEAYWGSTTDVGADKAGADGEQSSDQNGKDLSDDWYDS